jgi:hypothetical protein
MKHFFSILWNYWKENTRDSLKSTAHYFRYYSTSMILYSFVGMVGFPIVYGINVVSSTIYRIDIATFAISIIAHLISKLVIKNKE